jgi:hypothetical protein
VPAKLIRSTEDAQADADAEAQATQNAQMAETAAKLGKPIKDVTDAATLRPTCRSRDARDSRPDGPAVARSRENLCCARHRFSKSRVVPRF